MRWVMRNTTSYSYNSGTSSSPAVCNTSNRTTHRLLAFPTIIQEWWLLSRRFVLKGYFHDACAQYWNFIYGQVFARFIFFEVNVTKRQGNKVLLTYVYGLSDQLISINKNVHTFQGAYSYLRPCHVLEHISLSSTLFMEQFYGIPILCDGMYVHIHFNKYCVYFCSPVDS